MFSSQFLPLSLSVFRLISLESLSFCVIMIWCSSIHSTHTHQKHSHTITNIISVACHSCWCICVCQWLCVHSLLINPSSKYRICSFPIYLKCAASFQYVRHWTTTKCRPPGGRPSAAIKVCWSAPTSMVARTIGRYVTIRCCAFSAIWDPIQIRLVDAVALCKYILCLCVVKCEMRVKMKRYEGM